VFEADFAASAIPLPFIVLTIPAGAALPIATPFSVTIRGISRWARDPLAAMPNILIVMTALASQLIWANRKYHCQNSCMIALVQ
jgi:hypothetical protein